MRRRLRPGLFQCGAQAPFPSFRRRAVAEANACISGGFWAKQCDGCPAEGGRRAAAESPAPCRALPARRVPRRRQKQTKNNKGERKNDYHQETQQSVGAGPHAGADARHPSHGRGSVHHTGLCPFLQRRDADRHHRQRDGLQRQRLHSDHGGHLVARFERHHLLRHHPIRHHQYQRAEPQQHGRCVRRMALRCR